MEVPVCEMKDVDYDVCLLFERKCQSFDLAAREDRPEIIYHYWDPQDGHWPTAKKPDLIFFDPPASPERERWRAGPPYYTKKEKEYEKKAAGNPLNIILCKGGL